MWMDPTLLAVGALAAVFAGVSKGGFGSGAAFAAAAMLALVAPPAVAVGVMLPLLMLIDLGALAAWWGRWSRREAALLIVGGLPGVLLGVAFWRVAPADLIRIVIGLVALGFVVWHGATRRGAAPVARGGGRATGLLAGVVAGFTSFVSHAGGPPAAVYMLGRGLSKEAYQGTTVAVFFAINVMKLPAYVGLGLIGAESLKLGAVLAPFALLGTWLGVRAHRMISERAFFAVIYVLLSVTGAKLIWDGLA